MSDSEKDCSSNDEEVPAESPRSKLWRNLFADRTTIAKHIVLIMVSLLVAGVVFSLFYLAIRNSNRINQLEGNQLTDNFTTITDLQKTLDKNTATVLALQSTLKNLQEKEQASFTTISSALGAAQSSIISLSQVQTMFNVSLADLHREVSVVNVTQLFAYIQTVNDYIKASNQSLHELHAEVGGIQTQTQKSIDKLTNTTNTLEVGLNATLILQNSIEGRLAGVEMQQETFEGILDRALVEIEQLQDENNQLQRQQDNLITKIHTLEREVNHLKSGAASVSISPAVIVCVLVIVVLV